MKTKFKIGLMLCLSTVFMNCEKSFDEIHKSHEKIASNKLNRSIPCGEIEKPCYYKDSIRCATIVRVKSVICKQEGYELIHSKVEKKFENPYPNIQPPYISNIRNKKDSLIVEMVWEIDCKADGLTGIELIDSEKLNFLFKKYHTTIKDTSCFYTAEYVILKRKWSRLQFAFEGKNISVIAQSEKL